MLVFILRLISFLSFVLFIFECSNAETWAANISEMSPQASTNAGTKRRSEGNLDRNSRLYSRVIPANMLKKESATSTGALSEKIFFQE